VASVVGLALPQIVQRLDRPGPIATARAADLAPVIEDIRAGGAQSLRSIAAELNGRGISAPRGGEWSAAQVRAVESSR
jgi:hypothetical protein